MYVYTTFRFSFWVTSFPRSSTAVDSIGPHSLWLAPLENYWIRPSNTWINIKELVLCDSQKQAVTYLVNTAKSGLRYCSFSAIINTAIGYTLYRHYFPPHLPLPSHRQSIIATSLAQQYGDGSYTVDGTMSLLPQPGKRNKCKGSVGTYMAPQA